MSNDQLPTQLWVDAHLKRFSLEGKPYYIVNKGNYASGVVMVKIYSPHLKLSKVLQQQRNLDGEMGWMASFKGESVAESEADEYIQRAILRDPDLWVIEVEDNELENPFEGKEI